MDHVSVAIPRAFVLSMNCTWNAPVFFSEIGLTLVSATQKLAYYCVDYMESICENLCPENKVHNIIMLRGDLSYTLKGSPEFFNIPTHSSL